MSGGKVLSRVARRALHLEGYDGLQFYKFDRVKSAKLFKDQYRQALDELELTPSQVGKLVAEANVAFALNMRVFEELDVRGGVPGARRAHGECRPPRGLTIDMVDVCLCGCRVGGLNVDGGAKLRGETSTGQW